MPKNKISEWSPTPSSNTDVGGINIAEGMAPKVQAALDALSYGAQAVRIIDGTDPDSFASALAGTGGTLVVA